MEEDKQKKRNKKKKNKQKKAAEDAASGLAQTSSQQQDNNASDPSHPTQSNESHNTHESRSNGISEFLIENSSHHDIGSNGSVLATKEKQDWIKEEAILKVTIKELQLEVESRIRKEAELEMKLSNLQEEKDVSHQKEINFEDRISQLIREKETLSMEESNLLEKVKLLESEKVLWSQEQDSNKQKIAALNDENARLRVQVAELEGCGNKLLLEKQQLMENMSTLHSRIEDLERSSASAHSLAEITNDALKIDDLNCQIEAASQLVEKLITENADLVEKMNELYIELGHWRGKDGDFAMTMADSHFDSESGDAVATLAENADRSEEAFTEEEERLASDHPDVDHSAVMRSSSETSVSGEIVQIPLVDENESRDLEGQAMVNENIDGVPLTDAPLIGAPFRLISFVANYVSGADLVRESSHNAQ